MTAKPPARLVAKTPTDTPTPYVAEDYSRIFYRVSEVPDATKAQHLATTMAHDFDTDLIAVSSGKVDAPLHDHEGWEDCTSCPAVPVWSFDVYDRWRPRSKR